MNFDLQVKASLLVFSIILFGFYTPVYVLYCLILKFHLTKEVFFLFLPGPIFFTAALFGDFGWWYGDIDEQSKEIENFLKDE